jgi:hypothetical protein
LVAIHIDSTQIRLNRWDRPNIAALLTNLITVDKVHNVKVTYAMETRLSFTVQTFEKLEHTALKHGLAPGSTRYGCSVSCSITWRRTSSPTPSRISAPRSQESLALTSSSASSTIFWIPWPRVTGYSLLWLQ